jgi:phage tail-like protein
MSALGAGAETPYFPPPAFYFAVVVHEADTAPAPAIDGSFQEVSGLTSELTVEEVAEGGENRYVHRLPKRNKYSNLVLKRGLVTQGSVLLDWFKATLEGGLAEPVTLKSIDVQLLDARGAPVSVWSVFHAYPVKWAMDSFKATENKVSVETMELAFSYFQRTSR